MNDEEKGGFGFAATDGAVAPTADTGQAGTDVVTASEVGGASTTEPTPGSPALLGAATDAKPVAATTEESFDGFGSGADAAQDGAAALATPDEGATQETPKKEGNATGGTAATKRTAQEKKLEKKAIRLLTKKHGPCMCLGFLACA